MNKKNKTKKDINTGRPTKYEPRYSTQAYKLSLLGLTDEQIANVLEIAVSTLYEWKKIHVEFSESIKKGKDIADAEVVFSLYERAKGFTYDDVDIRVIEGKVVQTPIKKFLPSDTMAGMYWMNNRQKLNWKARQSEEETPPVIISVNVTEAETVKIGNSLMTEVFGQKSA